ncbi:alpha/beta fold hydrolase [Streptomyces sp. NPDC059982]|uniref:alpha/beta fold hydrolase n=1 Tax=unclassified Streptomyces TaxID=2593676 RepID=UPI003690F955
MKIDSPQGVDEQGFVRIGGVEVTDHIRTRLGVEKVILLGHSYGSAFGLRLAREFPERYSANVGTDLHSLREPRRASSRA